jgi:hypothetical protein
VQKNALDAAPLPAVSLAEETSPSTFKVFSKTLEFTTYEDPVKTLQSLQ